ncbi:MAG: exosome complex RNA-binding protein Csl4 [Nitrososphaerales archaeon]
MTLPGDKVASIEEFEGADGTYESDGIIRSSRLGKTVFDLKKRTVKIGEMPKAAVIPKEDDYVIGFVDMVGGSIVAMKILYVNDERIYGRIEAISVMRRGRGRRGGNMFMVGDIVRARVVSRLNSQTHVTFRDRNLGVIFTTCHSCGGDVVNVDGRVKCVECGSYEERKIAEDYGKTSLILPQYRGQ